VNLFHEPLCISTLSVLKPFSFPTGFSKHVGQLPILFVDDFELTQVHACIRYVARRYGFNGTTEQESARADEATELIYDLRLCEFNNTVKVKTFIGMFS
jgi:hypothetical protein